MNFLTIAAMALGLAVAPLAASAQARDCPPGLAKKSPPCIAPGQAKRQLERVEDRRDARRDDRRDERREDARDRHQRVWLRGQIFDGEYERFDDFERFGLRRLAPGFAYWRVGDQVLIVNLDTREILEVILLASLLN